MSQNNRLLMAGIFALTIGCSTSALAVSSVIHTTDFVVQPPRASILVDLVVYWGNWDGNRCKYVHTQDFGNYPILNKMHMELDANSLQSVIGPGFTCAEISYRPVFYPEKSVNIVYQLAWSGNAYVGTNPSQETIYF